MALPPSPADAPRPEPGAPVPTPPPSPAAAGPAPATPGAPPASPGAETPAALPEGPGASGETPGASPGTPGATPERQGGLPETTGASGGNPDARPGTPEATDADLAALTAAPPAGATPSEPADDPPPRPSPWRRRGAAPRDAGGGGAAIPAAKLLWVAGILLAMLVPHWFIAELIGEREERQDQVRREIAQSWGEPQAVLGPMLVVPYLVPNSQGGSAAPVWRRGSVVVLPNDLRGRVELLPETRRRGLFGTVVYVAKLDLAGSFDLAALRLPEAPDAEFLWREAQLVMGSNDLRLAGTAAPLRWEGRVIEPSQAALDPGLCPPAEALRWSLAGTAAPAAGAATPFALQLELRGTGGFRLVPEARQAEIAIAAAWPTPSFSGTDLPVRSEVTAEGFTADWATGTRAPLLRRTLRACNDGAGAAETGIGVELLEAVPTYRMVSRTSKYALFLLALAFVTYGLFEVTARVRIHPVQYALLGASVVLFPLLLLALGEPFGFLAAYGLSSAAVATQASIYTGAATGRPKLGAVLAAVLGGLFGFLYVVLSLEAYSLLTGTLALFAALSVVMAATRRVRWGGGGA